MNRSTSVVLGLLLLQAPGVGCVDEPRDATNEAVVHTGWPALHRASTAAPVARSSADHPFARHTLPKADRHWIAGHVEERVFAGNYVYMRLREPSGSDSWLVSLKATTPTAPDVRAFVVGHATTFHSHQLERDFSPLLFAAIRSDPH